MNAPICVACEVRMVCAKTGIDVELMAGKDPYQIWSGDLYRCPSCDIKVVSGFGMRPVAQTERYAQFVKGAMRFWNTLTEKKEAREA